MTLHLDPATEQRIQREIDLGHYTTPAEVITHALDLLTAEDDWLPINRAHLEAHLAESVAQAERGEVFSEEQILQTLSEQRKLRIQSH